MSKRTWSLLLPVLVALAAVALFARYYCCQRPDRVEPSAPVRERVIGRAATQQPRATPEEEHIDPQALRMAADYAATHDSRALIVSRHGHIVFEQYWQGTTADTLLDAGAFNRTITALMVGLARDDGKIALLDDPIADTVGGTIRQRLESPNGADVQSLVPLIERGTGQNYAEYLSHRLWKPLDAADAYVSPEGFTARAQDWMRVAQLLMTGGVYQGEEIVPRAWVNEMVRPSHANPNFGMQLQLGVPRHGFHLAAGGNRLWMFPTFQLAVLRLGDEGHDFDDARIPGLMLAGIAERGPPPATDLSTLVPHH